MNKQIVVFALLLVVISPIVFAADDASAIDQGNKFLAAEVNREIRTAQENILADMKSYQDENFRVFDSRMQQFMTDAKVKMALSAAGAALVASAIVALLLFRVVKNYSYEKYLEDRLGKFKDAEDSRMLTQGMEEMQRREWNVQPENKGMGTIYGQQEMSNMSQMNSWQAQPTYQGGWIPPVEIQKEYSQYPKYHPIEETSDPMDSPGWDMRGY